METNINPHLQEDESTMRPVEELTEIQMDPNEPSRVVKIKKRVKEGTSIVVHKISLNQYVFGWTLEEMVGIHPEVMCHRLNIHPQAKPVRQK